MSYEEVKDIVVEVANETKANVTSPSGYGDRGHNQFANEFCRNLHEKLQSRGINFEREKDIGNDLRPDVVIDNVCTIEVKTKSSGLDRGDREQMEKYKEAAGLPGMLVNFGSGGEPTIREFN